MIDIQTVYADLLFLVNFSMDMLCLILVAKLTSKRLSYVRALVAAAIGGIYSVAVLFIPNFPFLSFFLHLVCGIVISLTAFAKKGNSLGALASDTAMFFISSALLGGIMTAAFNLLNLTDIGSGGSEENGIPLLLILSAGGVSALAARIGGNYLKRRASKIYAEVEITLGERTLKLNSICDSGNLLHDSISGKSVVVADEKYIEYFFEGRKTLSLTELTSLPQELVKRAVLIPFQTAAGKRTLVAFRPHRLILLKNGKRRDVDALVGFAPLGGTPEDCAALIPQDIF